jgi:hypothetical protein
VPPSPTASEAVGLDDEDDDDDDGAGAGASASAPAAAAAAGAPEAAQERGSRTQSAGTAAMAQPTVRRRRGSSATSGVLDDGSGSVADSSTSAANVSWWRRWRGRESAPAASAPGARAADDAVDPDLGAVGGFVDDELLRALSIAVA